ncbi:MAG: phage tail sheath family protein, partial [Anaerolineae bacterium]
MSTYLTPGVYFETVDISDEGITAIRTDIAAFVGIAERGPLHKPTRVNSREQFRAAFGSFIPHGYLAYAAKAFFENGGRTCYVVRVAARDPSTETDPGVPQPADRMASVVLSVDGFAPGAVVTVRQDPDTQKDHLLRDVDQSNRRLIWERPLELDFALNDLGRPLQFKTGASAARGELLDENGKPTLSIEASSPGAWGDGLAVRVARPSPAATRATGAPQPADRSASRVETVIGFPEGSLVKVFQERMPTPLETYRIVKAVDPGRKLLTWDAPLDVAFDLTQPMSFETLEFALTVYFEGKVRELFSGLSLVAEHERYLERAITEETSHLIRVKDLGSPSPFPARLPDPAAANLTRGVLRLQAGRDGVAALQPGDFTGDPGSEDKWGLRTLEDVDEVAIVAVPDILIQPVPPVEAVPQPKPEPDPCLPGDEPPSEAEPPAPRLVERAPSFSLDQVFAVQQALVAHCEAQRDRIALLDPPVLSRHTDVVDIGEIQSWRQRVDSKYAALYYPWVLVYDPLRLGGQVVRAIPPSAHVAGIFARTDIETGVHKAPANAELRWAQDVTAEMQGLLNPLGINCIRSFPGRGLRLYGARTVSSDPAWRYVN